MNKFLKNSLLVLTGVAIAAFGWREKTPQEAYVDSLNTVNKMYNRQIEFNPDAKGHDVLTADINLAQGDCEDIQASKGLYLIQNGLAKPTDLKPILVLTDRGNYHILLVVQNQFGVYILDNLIDRVYTYKDLKEKNMWRPYTIWSNASEDIKIESEPAQLKFEKEFKKLFTNFKPEKPLDKDS